MVKEIKKQKKSKQKTEGTKIRVGDSEMSLEEYDFMIKMMEERQKPFKKWLEKEFKPNYFNYLKSKYSKRVCETRRDVCELFFDRCLYIGFIDLEMIRPEYAMFEFPYWWQTHVMWGNLSEIRISGYIKDMFGFISDKYGREVEGLFEIRKKMV